ncbi:MAG: formate/nitrite transporter family protein [Actinomycetota bacterium]|nr:formate/nitrite transporter family protein [Actinomycetota bacterium]
MAIDEQKEPEQVEHPSSDVQATQEEVRSAFWYAVERGGTRLDRHWLGLIATGAAAGLDVAVGAFGLLVVMQTTRNLVLASLTFSIGFIIVVFANSELFTENFLIPLSAVLTGRNRVSSLVRLWGATLVTNLAAGWVIAAILVSGFPNIKQQATTVSRFYLSQGFGWRSFSAAVFAGALVTLMTWMNSITTSQGTRLFSALVVGYVLALGQMPHCIVSGIEFFMALIGGAPFGYGIALATIAWMVLGNFTGGVLLAAGIRLAQVGGIELRRREREAESEGEQGNGQEEQTAPLQETTQANLADTVPSRQRIFDGIKDGLSPSPRPSEEGDPPSP